MADDLVRYLDAREAFSRAKERELARTEATSDEIAHTIWLDTLEEARLHNSPELQQVIGTTDAMLKAAFARETALALQEPAALGGAMLLYVFITAAFVGYAEKTHRRLLGAPIVQLALLALALSLIVDLDRVRSGTIKIDQTPLVSAAERVRQFEVQRRGAPPRPWLSPAPGAP